MADLLTPTNDPVLKRIVVPFNGAAPIPAPLTPMQSVPVPIPQAAMPSVVSAPTVRSLSHDTTAADTAELTRLQATPAGVDTIQSKPLRIGAKILDTIGRVVLPGAEQYIPGGEGDRQRRIGIQTQRVTGDLGREQQEAQTTLLDAQPALKQAALENATLKLQNQQDHWSGLEDVQREKTENQLREHGYKHNEKGDVVPLSYEELSSSQQAIEDLKHSQQEYADANAALKKAQNDPSSPAYQLAKSRVDVARQNAATAYGRLGLAAQNTGMRREMMNANLYGVGADGQQLTGGASIVDDQGNEHAVGLRVAPTAIKQQQSVASFNDLRGSISHTRAALKAYEQEGGSLSDARLIQAASDPHSTIGKMLNGKLVTGGLSPAAITLLNAVRQTHEQAGILRKTTGGTASEAGAQRILETVPTFGDSNASAYSKLDESNNVLDRLAPGQTAVRGGLSVSGRKPQAPSKLAPKTTSDPLGIF